MFPQEMFLAKHIGQRLGFRIDGQHGKRHMRDFFEHPNYIRCFRGMRSPAKWRVTSN